MADSYYILVNKDNTKVYTKKDAIVGVYTVFFNTQENAEAELAYLLDTDENFNEEDGWHVVRHRWSDDIMFLSRHHDELKKN